MRFSPLPVSAFLSMTLILVVSSPGFAGDRSVGAGQKKADRGPIVITNETLKDHLGPQDDPMQDNSGKKDLEQASKETCLPLEVLNPTGAEAVEVARDYLLTELDEIARQNDLRTTSGWEQAASSMKDLASRLRVASAITPSDKTRLYLGRFASDLEITAADAAATPWLSAERFRSGEPVFRGRL